MAIKKPPKGLVSFFGFLGASAPLAVFADRCGFLFGFDRAESASGFANRLYCSWAMLEAGLTGNFFPSWGCGLPKRRPANGNRVHVDYIVIDVVSSWHVLLPVSNKTMRARVTAGVRLFDAVQTLAGCLCNVLIDSMLTVAPNLHNITTVKNSSLFGLFVHRFISFLMCLDYKPNVRLLSIGNYCQKVTA
jgi:hypothetical protein